MGAPYSALAVANRFLSLAFSAGHQLDPLKLQKLLYFAQGWNLALFKKSLIREDIQAWKFGPVVDSVYQVFRIYGSNPITSLATMMQPNENGRMVSSFVPPVPEEESLVIKAVYAQYGKFDGVQLFKMTHADGTAWHKTLTAYGGNLPKFAPISPELIKQEFEEKLAAQGE